MEARSVDNNLSVGFLRSAKKFPERPALVVNNENFAYAQLSAMANGLKVQLQNVKSEGDILIGLFAYRSFGAFSGILGILSSGCGYMPLNPDLPKERNLKALNLSGVGVMIVSDECREAFDELLQSINREMAFICINFNDTGSYEKKYPKHRFIFIEDLRSEERPLEDIEPVSKDTLAYLLFTSGSTGEPKGVPVSHINVRSYVEFITGRYDINEHDRCSQMHDITFDFSVHDIYPTWEKGACLCIATKQDKLYPVTYIKKNKITSWASVPSIAAIIDKYGRLEPDVFPDLRCSFFCGEALFVGITEKWQKAASNSKIVNLYGPTETTMAISYYDWDSERSPDESFNGIVPIGKIFDGQRGRIIDWNRNEVNKGEDGELCLSGSQVTKGYWNSEKMTASQYITFDDEPDVLWYRTGDLVRETGEGILQYIGRADNQVQVLGNRVELGAIEEVLRDTTGVEFAVSLPWPVVEGNVEGVVAFLSGVEKMNEKDILDSCRQKLPNYMVPSRIHFVEDMPRNANGKIDRLQLRKLLEKT